jgi:hypothetical protein
MPTAFLEIPDASLTRVSEGQFADYLVRFGAPVVQHRGRYWTTAAKGFYQPINCLARLEPHEVSRPTLTCWGYRASIGENAAAMANGSIPMNLLSSLDTYTPESLQDKARKQLRKSRKLVSVRQLTDPSILREEAYGVQLSAFNRTGYGGLPDPVECGHLAERIFEGPRVISVFGAFVEGRLGAYLQAYALEDVVIMDKLFLATEYLPTAIGTALIFDFVQACKQTPGIREVVYGLHSAENPHLVHFKEGMGFKTVYPPSHLWMVPGAAKAIRTLKPYAYYRLSGQLPPSTEA